MNPLFTSLFGTKQGQTPASPVPVQNSSGQDWNAIMGQLQANPAEALGKVGYSIPQEVSDNPQAMVMHLLRTGQIGGPAMQMIRPMLGRMGIR